MHCSLQQPPGLPRCDLDVWMPILIEAQTAMRCLFCVQEIIYMASKLQMRHGFNLCVRMIEPLISQQGAVPTPEVVQSLGNFLKYFDFGGVSLWQDTSCNIGQSHVSAITMQHLEALLQCNLVHLTGRLITPTDGTHFIPRRFWQPLSGLTGLTTLHLTFQPEFALENQILQHWQDSHVYRTWLCSFLYWKHAVMHF